MIKPLLIPDWVQTRAKHDEACQARSYDRPRAVGTWKQCAVHRRTAQRPPPVKRVKDRITLCVFEHKILPVGVLSDGLVALSNRKTESGWRSISADGKDFPSSIGNDRSYLAVRIMAALADFVA